MPKIYEYFGLMFFIFTRNEHTPIHVHVVKGNKQSVVEIIYDEKNKKVVMVRRKRIGESESKSGHLSEKDVSTAVKFVNVKAEEFVSAWKQIEKGKYKISPVKITRKII